MKRVLKIILIFIMLLFMIGNYKATYASIWDDIFNQGDQFISNGRAGAATENKEAKIRTSASQIFYIVSAIGVGLTVIVGGILGIAFMTASVEDKAKIKEMMIPYIVGCIIIYGAFGIWKFTVGVMDSMDTSSTVQPNIDNGETTVDEDGFSRNIRTILI